MDAGRGDVPRLVDDLATGRLTGGAPPADYLLLLQEVVSEAGQPLVRTRRLLEFVVPVYRIATRLRSVAIVSTMQLSETRALTLPRERQPRMAAIAVVTVAATRLFVASTHLENRLSWWRGLFGDRARARQTQALLDALPDGSGVLGGDFNAMFGDQERAGRLLLRRFPDTAPMTTPTFGDRLVLDRLYFDLPDGWAGTTTVIDDQYNSDHHPVLGVIRAR